MDAKLKKAEVAGAWCMVHGAWCLVQIAPMWQNSINRKEVVVEETVVRCLCPACS